MAELFTNNASTTLSGSLTAVATSLSVAAGDGALFPDPTGGDYFRFILFKKSTGELEICKCTARTTDSFDTIVRGQEGTSGLACNDGDIIELRPTAAFFTSLATDEDIQGGQKSYAADTGAADAYEVTLSPVPSALQAGQVVRFKASATNTGASTIDVNSLGPDDIKKNVTDDLEAGDITQNGVYTLVFDGTNFQLTGPVTPIYNTAGSIQDNAMETATKWPVYQAAAPAYHTLVALGNTYSIVVEETGSAGSTGGSDDPTSDDKVASHTHTGGAHTHGAGTLTIPHGGANSVDGSGSFSPFTTGNTSVTGDTASGGAVATSDVVGGASNYTPRVAYVRVVTKDAPS